MENPLKGFSYGFSRGLSMDYPGVSRMIQMDNPGESQGLSLDSPMDPPGESRRIQGLFQGLSV
jgi:hypothetical protein